jgi:hypothetical protein
MFIKEEYYSRTFFMLGVLTFDDDVCILHAKVYGPSQDFTMAVKKAAVGKSEEEGKSTGHNV